MNSNGGTADAQANRGIGNIDEFANYLEEQKRTLPTENFVELVLNILGKNKERLFNNKLSGVALVTLDPDIEIQDSLLEPEEGRKRNLKGLINDKDPKKHRKLYKKYEQEVLESALNFGRTTNDWSGGTGRQKKPAARRDIREMGGEESSDSEDDEDPELKDPHYRKMHEMFKEVADILARYKAMKKAALEKMKEDTRDLKTKYFCAAYNCLTKLSEVIDHWISDFEKKVIKKRHEDALERSTGSEVEFVPGDVVTLEMVEVPDVEWPLEIVRYTKEYIICLENSVSKDGLDLSFDPLPEEEDYLASLGGKFSRIEDEETDYEGLFTLVSFANDPELFRFSHYIPPETLEEEEEEDPIYKDGKEVDDVLDDHLDGEVEKKLKPKADKSGGR
jgi:hypothetical protein